MIYLDNAATTGKKPVNVIKAVNNALINFSANPGRSGHDLSLKTAEQIVKCRANIKTFFNSSDENNVCFTYNCTHAINIVLNGVLNSGDHIIISSLEHNAVFRPVNYLKINKGIEFDVAEVDLLDDEITLKNIEKLFKKNTKMVFLTAASNVIGKKLPLKEIGELCKDNNILFGVDAAQAAGIIKIDMKKLNINFLCFAPHKGFYAPTGLGVLITEKYLNNILISGGTGVNSLEPVQPEFMPERIESGTQNVPAIFGLKSGIEFVNSIGQQSIEKHEISLVRYAYQKLEKLGSELYSACPDSKGFVPVLSFNVKGFSSEEISSYLNKNNIAVRAGFHCSPLAHRQLKTIDRGTVRISPSIFNTKNDIDRLIFSLKKVI